MKVLFVCTANRDRSRTAEIIFQYAYPKHTFRSCGINDYLSKRHGGIPIKQYMLDMADVVFCMEECHREYIVKSIGKHYNAKIKVLNLGDTESFMSDSLIDLLEEKIKEHIQFTN